MRKVQLVLFLLITVFLQSQILANSDPYQKSPPHKASTNPDFRMSLEKALSFTRLWYVSVYAPYLGQKNHSENVDANIHFIEIQLSDLDRSGGLTLNTLHDLWSRYNPALPNEEIARHLVNILNQLEIVSIPGQGGQNGNPFRQFDPSNPFAGNSGSKNPFGGDSKGKPGMNDYNNLLDSKKNELSRQAGLGPNSGLGHWTAGLGLDGNNPFSGKDGSTPGGIIGPDGNPVTSGSIQGWLSQEMGAASIGNQNGGWSYNPWSGYRYNLPENVGGVNPGANPGGGATSGGGVTNPGAGNPGAGGGGGAARPQVEMGTGARVNSDGTRTEETPEPGTVRDIVADRVVGATGNHSDAVRAVTIILDHNPSLSSSTARDADRRHLDNINQAEGLVTNAEYRAQVSEENHREHETAEQRQARDQERTDRVNRESREREREYERTHPRPSAHQPADGEDPGNPAATGKSNQPAEDGRGPINPAAIGKNYQPVEDGGGLGTGGGLAGRQDDEFSGHGVVNGGGFFQNLINSFGPKSKTKEAAK